MPANAQTTNTHTHTYLDKIKPSHTEHSKDTLQHTPLYYMDCNEIGWKNELYIVIKAPFAWNRILYVAALLSLRKIYKIISHIVVLPAIFLRECVGCAYRAFLGFSQILKKKCVYVECTHIWWMSKDFQRAPRIAIQIRYFYSLSLSVHAEWIICKASSKLTEWKQSNWNKYERNIHSIENI